MNNSKKLKPKKENKDKLIEKKPISQISLPWVILSGLLIISLVVALLFDQLYERTVLSIDGEKYKMNDLAYYFYTVESQYNYYDQMFGGNGAYWDQTYDEESGNTVRDMAMDTAVNASLQNEILYKEAVAEGYTLTEDETQSVSSQVDEFWNNTISSSEKSKNSFTKGSLTDVIGKVTLVERYRKEKIDALPVDDESIKAGINYDDYRQYDIEYLYISTSTTDEDANNISLPDNEKKAALDKITAYYEQAENSEDWSTLLPEDENDVDYRSTHFLESDAVFSDEMEAMMTALENGEVSDIFDEANDGYYIVRMVDNNSTESYDNAVSSAISKAEDDAFETLYQEDIQPKHSYKVNEKAISSMTMGNLTID